MNPTVAVALVTSLSTLAAAGLTGTISARLTRRQLEHQRVLAREQRAEERADHRRELRREVYQHFVSQVDEAYRVLDAGWFAAPFTGGSHWEGGFAARRALDEANVRVQLEGPEEVATQAAEVVRSVGREFREHRRILDAHPGATGSAAELDAAGRTEVLKARFRTTAEFISSARRELNEPAPATDSRGI
ncbi:hypothetical protein [Amycolatopsis sp. NPDC098790]|uniref:hypothetical protein n=1 Tax=Amycolatopsis sp. NPDC098790 TaxID=3363939 RepID=UPI0038124DDA